MRRPETSAEVPGEGEDGAEAGARLGNLGFKVGVFKAHSQRRRPETWAEVCGEGEEGAEGAARQGNQGRKVGFLKRQSSRRRPETWAKVCGEGEDGAEAGARLDAYAGALDEVEGRLLQEIAARSPHFFEAAGVVQDLRGALARTFASVAGLRRQANPAPQPQPEPKNLKLQAQPAVYVPCDHVALRTFASVAGLRRQARPVLTDFSLLFMCHVRHVADYQGRRA